jgi:hypothetical protein
MENVAVKSQRAVKFHKKYDLSNRLYPITELIQKVAVKRQVMAALVRDEILTEIGISVSLLSQLESAQRGDKKPTRLTIKMEIRLNDYFRRELENKDIYVCQMTISFKA